MMKKYLEDHLAIGQGNEELAQVYFPASKSLNANLPKPNKYIQQKAIQKAQEKRQRKAMRRLGV